MNKRIHHGIQVRCGGGHKLDRPSARRAQLISGNMKVDHEDRKVFVSLLYRKSFSIDSGWDVQVLGDLAEVAEARNRSERTQG